MSKIAWTNQTWNPIIGCLKVSQGCKNCYAEKMACRLACMEYNISAYDYRHVVNGSESMKPTKWNGKTFFAESQLEKPLKRKKPTMYFVCSMGDLFHESVAFSDIRKVFDVIRKCPQHTFQILTKRPERMRDFYLEYYGFQNEPNVWLGVTTENQEQANKRIPVLLKIPAKVRFVSVEPMLGAVSLMDIKGNAGSFYQVLKPITGCGDSDRSALDWVITGGESGHNARPMHPDWVRSLRDQCELADVPFFFKQWGEWWPGEKGRLYREKSIDYSDGQTMVKVGKRKAGYLLDGKEYKQFPKL